MFFSVFIFLNWSNSLVLYFRYGDQTGKSDGINSNDGLSDTGAAEAEGARSVIHTKVFGGLRITGVRFGR